MKTFRLGPIGLSILLVFPILSIALGLFIWEPDWLFHRSELRTGNEIVARVEAFRASHGHLPETLEDVGINDPEPSVFYRKISDQEYEVWFGRFSLGESEKYSSVTQKWE